MRKIFKISTTFALLALSACSPQMLDEVVLVEEPVIVEAPAASVDNKGTCGNTAIDDGIGGTGCPAPIE